MKIALTSEDWMVAAVKGAIRQLQAIRKGRVGHDHGNSSKRTVAQRLGDSIIGELGEMAVMRCLRLPQLSAFEDTKSSDVGGFEVRTTDRKCGCLLVHKSSADEARYVLVVVDAMKMEARVCGWIRAIDGKNDLWWRDGDPGCYYVPQSELHPIEALRYESVRGS